MHEAWLPVTREDGETVGYLDPATEDYARVVPRNRLGHPLGPECGYDEGEEAVLRAGLGLLSGSWWLDGVDEPLAILELSDDGIVLADAQRTKALAPADPVRVPWPDREARLRPAS